ncbi:MAG: hypothetical protein H6937_07250 [Burkholderiales bacterium]|nr:hypothetical protein [Burkholderiales bacterium]MDR4516241.1 hypothetical protein [Nitrosomonas sp.]
MIDKRVYLVCCIVALVILFIDISIPLGVANGVAYIVVILLSLKATQQRTTIILAFLCTILIVVGFYASPEGGVLWQVIFNRILAVAVVWVTAFLALNQIKIERQISENRLNAVASTQTIQLQQAKLTVLKATMRTVLDIVGNFLNSLQLIRIEIETKKTLTDAELKQLDTLIHDTALQLRKLGEIDSVNEKEMAGGMIGIDFENKKHPRDARSDPYSNQFSAKEG